MISIVVPTYREAANLPHVAKAVDEACAGLADDYELLFIDDDSQDGSEEICAELSERFPVRIVVRKGERGLATAVIHGIAVSSGDIVVVMDADLSHPPWLTHATQMGIARSCLHEAFHATATESCWTTP